MLVLLALQALASKSPARLVTARPTVAVCMCVNTNLFSFLQQNNQHYVHSYYGFEYQCTGGEGAEKKLGADSDFKPGFVSRTYL